jgi:uncharacterized RDD family membrane protein YckC
MRCPKCQNGEINGLKSCPLCGFQTGAEVDAGSIEVKPHKSRSADSAGMIEMDYSGHPEESQTEPRDMPEWRQQVARRLQEIKQKRQANSGGGAEVAPLPLPFPEPEKIEVQSRVISLAKGAGNEEKLQAPGGIQPAAKSGEVTQRKVITPRASRKQPSLQALLREPLPGTEKPPVPGDSLGPAGQTTAKGNPAEIKNLIDNVVIRQIVPPSAKSSETTPTERRALSLTRYEDKLTLLSRAFSGMVDLVIMALCVGTFIFAIDAFSGIVVVDTFSWISYGLLFLATYFVYSFFFLGTINQTVGMMITDLRVVDEQGKRPPMRQILGRSCSFVPSLLVAGAGLIWGIIDRDSRCLHDRLSGTHVVRI